MGLSTTELKKKIFSLLKEDEEFRLAVSAMLGITDIHKTLGMLTEVTKENSKRIGELIEVTEQHSKNISRLVEVTEEHSRRIDELSSSVSRLVEVTEEHSRRIDELSSSVSRLVEVTEEHSRRIDELSSSVSRLVEVTEEHSRSIDKLAARLEVTIGSMGRRWGIDLERTVLAIFTEILERRGIEPGKVEKFRFKDVEGRYTRKGTIVDVDVLVRDEKLYVIEVKSRAEIDHVEMLPDKASVVEKILGRKVDKVLLVAVNIDDDAMERAKELGIETIYGNVIKSP